MAGEAVEVQKCFRVLQQMRLAFDIIDRPRYPKDLPAFARSASYYDVWKKILDSRSCSIVLADLSLLQFRHDDSGNWQSLAFYECPRDVGLYSDFRDLVGRDGSQDMKSTFVEVAETFSLKKNPLHVRYDFDPNAFVDGRHPYAHIHFGHNSPVRVACERLWIPSTMTAFVVRQFYPQVWIEFLTTHPRHGIIKKLRDGLSRVPAEYLQGKSMCEALVR